MSNQQDGATNTIGVGHSVESQGLRDDNNARDRQMDNVSNNVEAERDAEIQRTANFMCATPHKESSCNALERFESNAHKID